MSFFDYTVEPPADQFSLVRFEVEGDSDCQPPMQVLTVWKLRERDGDSVKLETKDFWAKTTAAGRPGISVRDHCLNVGCVTEAFAALLAARSNWRSA